MTSQFEPGLRRILWELRDYLPDVIVVGGWVPYLYQRYGGFAQWTGRISLTGEVDVLVGPRARPETRRPLEQVLREGGFEPIAGSDGAAWQQDPGAGEKVEFLMPNRGPQKWEGTLRPVPGQPGVAAVALDDLRMLEQHTGSLTLPILLSGAPADTLTIQVPTLGAYVVNKAITFNKRRLRIEAGVAVGNPKRAKDLLYVHDVVAGGTDVVARVTQDLTSIRRTQEAAGFTMSQAAGQIRLAVREPSGPLAECAAMLAERDGLSPREAHVRLEGYLFDLAETLEEASA